MGFRKDSWATVWSVEPRSDTLTQVRLSISRKDKSNGEYVQDFSGFVAFLGTATAKKAANLKEKDRIKLGDVDVSSGMTEKDGNKVIYYNFRCFSFEKQDEEKTSSAFAPTQTEPQPAVDEGANEDKLPF